MYLSSLRIIEGIEEEKVVRDLQFKKGLNIIVDDSEESGNNVGKTTVLKIIDICLGANDRKYIWIDYDTGSETSAVKDYIVSKKVFAELVFRKGKDCHTLKVELFPKGKYYIDGEYFSQKNFRTRMNSIIFGIEGRPSFRQLMSKFVRIKQKKDSNEILKCLHQNTKAPEYKNIYNFLFKLSSHSKSNDYLILSEEISEISNKISQLVKIHKFSNIADLNERIKIVSKTVSELKVRVDTMVSVDEYTKKLNVIDNVNKQVTIINDSIERAIFKKSKIEKILLNEEDKQKSIDNDLLLEFYNDVKQTVENISVQFNELIQFNNKIVQNKITYYRSRVKEIDFEITELTREREEIIQAHEGVICLINRKNFDDFQNVHKELIQQSELLGSLKEVKTLYDELTCMLGKKKEKLEEAEETSGENSDNLSTFNSFFSEISNAVLGQRLYLSHFEPFPLKLSNVDDGIGTGDRKAIALLLDTAYVSFINKLALDFPMFFVHDVLETMSQENHRKIVEYINENGSQFIFAVLNEKIKDYDFVDENDVCLRLSKTEKLFKV